jgi:hypothetical protein
MGYPVTMLQDSTWLGTGSGTSMDGSFFLIVFPEQCRVLPAYPPASYEQGDEDKTNEGSNTDNNPE